MSREWHTLGIHIGYRYEGSPICWPDGSQAPADDPGTYVPTARPAHRAPHAWLADGRSTLDLFGRGFTLLGFGATGDEARPLLPSRGRAHDANGFCGRRRTAYRDPVRAQVGAGATGRHVAWRDDHLPDDPLHLIDVVRGAAEVAGLPADKRPVQANNTSATL